MNQIDAIHPYWLVVMGLALSALPILVGLCSAYLKVSIVLGLLRSGLGAQQVPSNMLVMALSLALSMYIMAPACSRTWQLAEGVDLELLRGAPLKESFIRLRPLLEPWREFMAAHAGEREIEMLLALAMPAAAEEQSVRREHARHTPRVLIPAFVLTEVKEAFAMGFVLLLPFLVIDLTVANVLAGMGMLMVSPAMVSLPLKLVLFVVADGWLLISKSLLLSYGG